LLFMLADNHEQIALAEPPATVTDWLAGRDQRAQAAEKAPPVAQPSETKIPAKNLAARENEALAGVDELDLWLRDVIRQGLAQLRMQSESSLHQIAARMQDAKVPGLRRRVLDLGIILNSGEGWQDRVLEQIGQLYLLVSAYRRLSQLNEFEQADLRTALGFSLKREDVRQLAGIQDRWCCLGQITDDIPHEQLLRSRRTWLIGEQSRQYALLLEFSFNKQPFEEVVRPGLAYQHELAFYPSTWPLRAEVKPSSSQPEPFSNVASDPSIQAALARYSAALAVNPWIETFPFLLKDIRPYQQNQQWLVVDHVGRALPVSSRFDHVWRLLALSGGQPLDLFGEWNGTTFLPLTAGVNNRLLRLT
jgi:hypothetical protein